MGGGGSALLPHEGHELTPRDRVTTTFSEGSGAGVVMEPVERPLHQQAAAELRQELALVSRALFAQLLPGSADHALSGVGSVTDSADVHASAAALATTEVVAPTATSAVVSLPSQDIAIDMPGAVAIEMMAGSESVTEAAHEVAPLVPYSVPSLPLPPVALLDAIEVLDVPATEATATEVPPVDALAIPVDLGPAKPDHRSQAMLAEIGFLDEDTRES